MKPKASLKSLNVKVRPIASRPGVSAQPGNPCKADFRISAVSRSAMTASVCCDLPNILAAFEVHRRARAGVRGHAPRKPTACGNHDADVTPSVHEICYNIGPIWQITE